MNMLPPLPVSLANPQVQQKIEKQMTQDESFNFTLQSMKSFHNPSILNTIATIYEIDQNGSNYPPQLFDPEVHVTSFLFGFCVCNMRLIGI